MAAIAVVGAGKAFKRYASRWSRLAEWVLPYCGRRHDLMWVLRDIDFVVEAGESMGIVGVNGAGKSTLLKLITGTLQSTSGSVQVHGRIAALLELGMGFHPQFSGRENVVMAGQLLGLGTQEIAELMSGIESFADIGGYIDQPVRIYSSGMQVRLAFSVATARRPDILIIDEALSVGDAAFQRKCFQRIEDYRAAGTTLLFVSHSIDSVRRLCDRALFIHGGGMRALGPAKEVCDEYERAIFGGGGTEERKAHSRGPEPKTQLDPKLDASSIEKQYGDGGATISAVRLVDSLGRAVNVIPEGVPFSVMYQIRFSRDVEGVTFGMMVKNLEGVCIYGTTSHKYQLRDRFLGGDSAEVRFDLHGNLVSGTYYLNVGSAHQSGGEVAFLHRRVDCLIFRVVSGHWRIGAGYANLFATPSLETAR